MVYKYYGKYKENRNRKWKDRHKMAKRKRTEGQNATQNTKDRAKQFHLYCDGYTEAYLKADFVNTQVTKTQIFN
jgi:hypothetical protein